jgi:hypothetical protein
MTTVLVLSGAGALLLIAVAAYKHFKDERDYAARWRGPYWRD